MGFFDALGDLASAGIKTVLLPVDVAKDVLTCGGVLDDPNATPATVKRLKEIVGDIEEAADDVKS